MEQDSWLQAAIYIRENESVFQKINYFSAIFKKIPKFYQNIFTEERYIGLLYPIEDAIGTFMHLV